MKYKFLLLVSSVFLTVWFSWCDDWPQFQHDAQRTGRTVDTVFPPYRVRWIWLGPNNTIRNILSNSSWSGLPNSGNIPPGTVISNVSGISLPNSVPFTFASSMQPVIASSKVFVGDLDGKAYAINENDGTTLWISSIPGGTLTAAAVSEDKSIVIYCTITGTVYGFRVTDGTHAWTPYQCRGAITGAPCVSGNNVYIADHKGYVYALNTTNGILIWNIKLPAPVQGTIACDSTSVYVCAENMYVYALDIGNGQIRASSQRIRGQSFRFLWPVVFNNKLWIESVPVPCVGSCYVMETVMADAPDQTTEETYIGRWLSGDSNGGRWTDASPDWKHFTVLNISDLSEPFQVQQGPFDGVGDPPDPPVIDNQGRVLTYFKTKFATLARPLGFGSNYDMDISAINLTNGKRILINNGHRADNAWYTWETDNLYGMSVGGNLLFLHQDFRGTVCIDLTNSNARSVYMMGWDTPNSDIQFVIGSEGAHFASTTMTTAGYERTPVVISGNRIYIRDSSALICGEHHQ